ncbi:DUF6011 domain-containing protein [Streptomyces cellulosae]
MTDTTTPPVAINFETRPCGRCFGSGEFGPKSVEGGVCFGCRGAGDVNTRRGRLAFTRFEEAVTARMGRPAAELKPGDKVWASYTVIADGWRPVEMPKAWRTVVAVKVGEPSTYTYKVGDEEHEAVTMTVTLTFRVKGKEVPCHIGGDPADTTAFLVPVYDSETLGEVMTMIAKKYTGAWLEGEEPPARPKPRLRTTKEAAPKPEAEAKPLPANLYPGDCRNCGGHVAAKEGERLRLDGAWRVQHKPGECQERPAAEEPQEAPQEAAEEPSEPNRYGGRCAECNGWVEPQEGRRVRREGGWVTLHADGKCPEAPAAMPNKFAGRCDTCDTWVGEGKGERVQSLGVWITRHRPGQCPDDTTVHVTEEGLYRLPGDGPLGGGVFRVRTSERSGRLYAETFTPHTKEGGGARFVYDPAAVYSLRPEHRMTAEEAADIGRHLHTCMQCGEHLTDPKSVARGIGPVCAKKV